MAQTEMGQISLRKIGSWTFQEKELNSLIKLLGLVGPSLIIYSGQSSNLWKSTQFLFHSQSCTFHSSL